MAFRANETHVADPKQAPDSLFRRIGRLRAKFHRLFEPSGGARHCIQQRYLIPASQTNTDPATRHERISAIAGRYDLASAFALSRAFRAAFDLSPSDMHPPASAVCDCLANAQYDDGSEF